MKVQNNADLPFMDDADESAGFLLWQATTLWQRQIRKALEPYQLTHPQFVLMASLLWLEMHDGQINQTHIVSWTKLDKMTVSSSLKKLVEQGYVRRTEHEVDTRAKSISLTKLGKQFIKQVIPIVENIDKIFFGALDAASQGRMKQSFRKLILQASMNSDES